VSVIIFLTAYADTVIMAAISSTEDHEIVGFPPEQQKELSDLLSSSKKFSNITNLAPLRQ